MNKQEIFTRASQTYLLCQRLIKQMCHSREGKTSECLNSFDVMLEIILLYTSIIDSEVYDIELKFIELITIEDDVLKSSGKNISWKNIKDLKMTDFNNLVDELYEENYLRINTFVMFLASVDAITTEDYLSKIVEYLKEIVSLFSLIDEKKSGMETEFIDFVLNKILINPYKELKEIYSVANKKVI